MSEEIEKTNGTAYTVEGLKWPIELHAMFKDINHYMIVKTDEGLYEFLYIVHEDNVSGRIPNTYAEVKHLVGESRKDYPSIGAKWTPETKESPETYPLRLIREYVNAHLPNGEPRKAVSKK